jgi:hypothetical protein
MTGGSVTRSKPERPSPLGLLAMVVAVPTLIACGGAPSGGEATAASVANGYRVSVQRWQKDAYRDRAGLTPGWPRHTTLAVSIIDPSGAVTFACEADNHGSSLASGLVEAAGSAKLCAPAFASLADAQKLAATICSCVCDSMGGGATAFLSDDVASDLQSARSFFASADHAALNQALGCDPAAGADPAQRLADDVLANPPRYDDALALLTNECSPRWDQAFTVLLGGVFAGYHVCNNDAALEEWACSTGSCPSWNGDAAVIRNACDGPRIMNP